MLSLTTDHYSLNNNSTATSRQPSQPEEELPKTIKAQVSMVVMALHLGLCNNVNHPTPNYPIMLLSGRVSDRGDMVAQGGGGAAWRMVVVELVVCFSQRLSNHRMYT